MTLPLAQTTASAWPSFRIHPGPILLLNGLFLAGLALFCALFPLLDPTSAPQVLAMIQLYFLGIGGLIAIAASWLSWLSGPVVTVTPQGLTMSASWVMDTTYPQQQHFEMPWASVTDITPVWFLCFPYWKITAETAKTQPFFLPRWLIGQRRFGTAVTQALQGPSSVTDSIPACWQRITGKK